MANISKIKLGTTEYDISDSTARSSAATNASAISALQTSVSTANNNKLSSANNTKSTTLNTISMKNSAGTLLASVALDSATTSAAGLMSATDKARLDALLTASTGNMRFLGVTTTTLSDGASTPESGLVGDTLIKKTGFISGDVVIYGNKEFIYNGSKWAEFGDLTTLGRLAKKDSASGTVTSTHTHTTTITPALILGVLSVSGSASNGTLGGNVTARGSVSLSTPSNLAATVVKTMTTGTRKLIDESQIGNAVTVATPNSSASTVVSSVSGGTAATFSVANEILTITPGSNVSSSTTSIKGVSGSASLRPITLMGDTTTALTSAVAATFTGTNTAISLTGSVSGSASISTKSGASNIAITSSAPSKSETVTVS